MLVGRTRAKDLLAHAKDMGIELADPRFTGSRAVEFNLPKDTPVDLARELVERAGPGCVLVID